MHAKNINEKKDMSLKDMGGLYGKFWREEREGERLVVNKLQSQK